MTVEAAGFIDDIDPTQPPGTDNFSEGDDHLRNFKKSVQNSFPNIAGAVTATETELNILDGAVLRHKVINIGDWDMDTYDNVFVAHELTLSKIREVSVMIISDDGGNMASIDISNGSGAGASGVSIESSTVGLNRLAGGFFDNTSYDSTFFNRGWITIQYVD